MCVSISKRCLVWEQGAAVGLEANWMCPESRPKHQSPHKRARGCVCVSGFMQTSLVQVGKAQFLCEKCNLVFLSLPAGTCHFRLCPTTPFLKYYPFYILPIPPTLSHTACFVPICKTQDSLERQVIMELMVSHRPAGCIPSETVSFGRPAETFILTQQNCVSINI